MKFFYKHCLQSPLLMLDCNKEGKEKQCNNRWRDEVKKIEVEEMAGRKRERGRKEFETSQERKKRERDSSQT